MTNSVEKAILAGGCFWGMQDLIRKRPGVLRTRVGYTGGDNNNPTYRNHPGHAEAIEIEFDPALVSYRDLLEFFFQIHDPTTPNRQGNDIGTQYRSAVYTTTDEQLDQAMRSQDVYQAQLTPLGFGDITTEIAPLGEYYYAEDYHQQYLGKNPHGYDCHANTGIAYPGLD